MGAGEGVSGVPLALCVPTAFPSSMFFLRGNLCIKAAPHLPTPAPQTFAILMIIGLYLQLNQSVPVQPSLAQINHSFLLKTVQL